VTTETLTIRRPTLLDRPILAGALLLLGAAVTAGASLAGNGNPVFALLPVLAAGAAYLFYVLPIRYALLGVIFASLTLDAIEEGPWSSPLAPIGSLLANNLNKSLPIPALMFPGVAVVLAAMVLLIVKRSLMDDRTDLHGRTPVAPPVFAALAVSFTTVFVLCALGKLRGGDMQMAKIQVQAFVLLLVFGYVAAMSLRGVEDYRTLGRLIVIAAVARSFYIFYVVHHLAGRLPDGGTLAVAATHGDSMVLSAAAVLLVVRFMEAPSRRSAFWCITIIPILLVAMNLNNRRLVWVQLAGGLLTFALVSRRSPIKRLMVNIILLSLPLIIGYIAVGWNSQAKIFAPIKMYRSVSDGKVDSSTLYRDLENFNLMMTMRIHPLTGTGFGQPFEEVVTLPSIASIFREYRYIPHNAILGLWAFAGPLGFSGLYMAMVVAAFFGFRSYRLATTTEERTSAVMVIAMLVIYFAQCWGDMGFTERRSMFLVGPVLAMAGQLAYKTGAYRPVARAVVKRGSRSLAASARALRPLETTKGHV
jgi:hypothetical protein